MPASARAQDDGDEDDVATLERRDDDLDSEDGAANDGGEPGEEAAATDGDDEPGEGSEADGDEVVVTIGAEAPPEPAEEAERAPQWVRDLRKRQRELEAENRELRRKQQQAPAVAVAAVVDPGPKPTLQGCDYDEEKFETALSSWHERKRAADVEREAREKAKRDEETAWNATVETYNTRKRALKVKDFDDAEAEVLARLSQAQQGIILHGTGGQAEVIVYALGKNPKRLQELAAITDPVKFAFSVADLKGQLKVTTRKPPAPARALNGGAPSSPTGSDKQLERLRADAEKTGNYTQVIAYKARMRQQAAG